LDGRGSQPSLCFRLLNKSLHQDYVVLRLSPADAAELISRGGRVFEPIKGRRSKDRHVPESSDGSVPGAPLSRELY